MQMQVSLITSFCTSLYEAVFDGFASQTLRRVIVRRACCYQGLVVQSWCVCLYQVMVVVSGMIHLPGGLVRLLVFVDPRLWPHCL